MRFKRRFKSYGKRKNFRSSRKSSRRSRGYTTSRGGIRL